MGQFRTSSLFHYTKSIDILYSILMEGLIPNYCYEDLSYKRNPDRGIEVQWLVFVIYLYQKLIYLLSDTEIQNSRVKNMQF